MKTSGYLVLGAVGITVGVGALLGFRRQPRPARAIPRPKGRLVELNQATMQDFLDIGLDEQTAARIIEERPYRNKLELVSRMVVPAEVYEMIRNKIFIAEANQPVIVAS